MKQRTNDKISLLQMLINNKNMKRGKNEYI